MSLERPHSAALQGINGAYTATHAPNPTSGASSSNLERVSALSTPLLDASPLGDFKRQLLTSLRNALTAPRDRSPQQLVNDVWSSLPAVEGESLDVRPALVERALETITSEQANGDLKLLERAFDLIIAHDEQGLCTESTFFNAFELVLEAQSVSRAEQTFGFLERRSGQVIKDMRPDRGKGPVLLRACNELRRRLSKVTHLDLYGRIGLLLAASFASGDRSSVNLRGDYNLDNVTSFEPPPQTPTISPVPEAHEAADDLQAQEDDGVMDVDAEEKAELAKDEKSIKEASAPTERVEDFYATFWSLQRFLNYPPSLFSAEPLNDIYILPAESLKASTSNLKALRHGLIKVFEAFSAATKKERAVAGAESKGKGSIKSHTATDVKSEYFFPKYLTSRALLELQITDVHFRRQILVQIIITLQFLLGLTLLERDKLQQAALRVTGKATLSSSIKANMILSEDDAKWVAEAMSKCRIELRQTLPDGETFLKSVQLILEREQNWISMQCRSFEKPRAESALFEDAEKAQKQMQAPFKPFEHALGTATLSRLWAVDTSLDHFQKQSVATFNEYHERSKAADAEISARKVQLAKQGLVMPAQLAEDNELQYLLARKTSTEWRGLRRALTEQSGLATSMSGEPTLDNVARRLDLLTQKLAKRKAATTSVKTEKTASSSPVPPEPSQVQADPAIIVIEAADGRSNGNAESDEPDDVEDEEDEEGPGDTASQPIEISSNTAAASENGDVELVEEPAYSPPLAATEENLVDLDEDLDEGTPPADPGPLKRLREEEARDAEPTPKRARSVDVEV